VSTSAALQPAEQSAAAQQPAPHVLGVVFPGYHKDELNDHVWGDNYTEWWRADDGEVLIRGQHQPQMPIDRYDLSEPAALKRLASVAHANGVDSLLMYHYWFRSAKEMVPGLKSKRVLRGPLDTLLAHPEIETSFALAWADMAMTKKAQGYAVKGASETNLKWGDTFMPNDHTEDDDREHAQWLIKNVFSDPRQLKVDGKPLFAVFSTPNQDHPGYRLNFLKLLRQEARSCCAMELYLVEFIQRPLAGDGTTRMERGKRHPDDADALLLFAGGFQKYESKQIIKEDCYATSTTRTLTPTGRPAKELVNCTVLNYEAVAEKNVEVTEAAWAARSKATHPFDVIPAAMPGWDNTGRYPHGGPSLFIARGNTPERFGRWMDHILRGPPGGTTPPKLVAINAINEWGEGCHLEPDTKFGMSFYEALKASKQKALESAQRVAARSISALSAVAPHACNDATIPSWKRPVICSELQSR